MAARNQKITGTISPSKYTSLEKLKKIQLDHCVGVNGFDYDKSELDFLIMCKQDRLHDIENERRLREYEQFLEMQ